MSRSRVPVASPSGAPRQFWVRAAALLLVHPELWATAVAHGVKLARPGWWRSRPFLPVPAPGYLRFRFETAYGPGGRPEPRDLVDYLRWCRARPR